MADKTKTIHKNLMRRKFKISFHRHILIKNSCLKMSNNIPFARQRENFPFSPFIIVGV